MYQQLHHVMISRQRKFEERYFLARRAILKRAIFSRYVRRRCKARRGKRNHENENRENVSSSSSWFVAFSSILSQSLSLPFQLIASKRLALH